jgi:hypothetical protein
MESITRPISIQYSVSLSSSSSVTYGAHASLRKTAKEKELISTIKSILDGNPLPLSATAGPLANSREVSLSVTWNLCLGVKKPVTDERVYQEECCHDPKYLGGGGGFHEFFSGQIYVGLRYDPSARAERSLHCDC